MEVKEQIGLDRGHRSGEYQTGVLVDTRINPMARMHTVHSTLQSKTIRQGDC